MKRKRIIAILLCFVMMAGLLTACGKKKEEEPMSPVDIAKEENTKDSQTKPTNDFGLTEEKLPLGEATQDGLMLLRYQPDYERSDIPKSLQTMGMKALGQEEGKLISTNPSFLLTAELPLAVSDIETNLHLLSSGEGTNGKEISYTVTAKDGDYLLTPSEELLEDSLYQFVLGQTDNPYMSYVFQTEQKNLIRSVYPADKAIDVPTNTGVEVVLSEAVASDVNLEDFIEIIPKTEGSIKAYPDGKTIVFYPQTQFMENTVFTITVKKGLRTVSKRQLENTLTTQFRTGIETSYDEKSISIQLTHQEISVVPEESAKLELRSWYNRGQELHFNDALVSIYAYRSPEECIEAMKVYQQNKADYFYESEGYFYPTSGLTKVNEFTTPLTPPENNSWESLISLPGLEEGSYLVELTICGDVSGKEFETKKQVLLQVSDLLLYTESCEGKTLYWVSDCKGGKNMAAPVAGANLSITYFSYEEAWNLEKNGTKPIFEDTVRYTTDNSGVVVVNSNPETQKAAFVLIQAGNKKAIANVLFSSDQQRGQYHSFLYTDREEYFRNDVIRFFGIVAPKYEGGTLPKRLLLRSSDALNPIIVLVKEDGSFEGSIELDDSQRWYMTLRFADEEDNFVVSKGVSITDEKKPVYVGEAKLDRMYYRRGDTIEAKINLSFYDGTPAPGLKFDVSFSSRGDSFSTTVETDDKGEAKASWKPISITSNSTEPVYVSMNARLIGDELSNLWLSASAKYFHSDKIFEAERLVPEDGSESYTSVRLFERDYSKLLTEQDLQYPDYPLNSYGEKLDGKVKVRLIRTDIEKELVSTDYDPITKTNLPNYRYSWNEVVESERTVQVINGELKLNHFKKKEGVLGYYTYNIIYTDPETNKAHTVSTYAMVGADTSYRMDETKYYDFVVNEGPYSIGSEIHAKITYGDELLVGKPVLFTLYSEQGVRYHLSENGCFDITFDETMAPVGLMYATTVDSDGIQLLGYRTLRYDFDKNNTLSFALQTDKETYRPGEVVKLTITRNDTIGNEKTFFAISVVDEACFDLQEQSVKPSNYLAWNNVYVGQNLRFSAYGNDTILYRGRNGIASKTSMAMADEAAETMDNAVMLGAGMDNGGGNGETVTIRKDFLDNPVFLLVPMGKKKTETVEFTVPDNITEWRITAIACDPCLVGGAKGVVDVKLGYQQSDVITTLPFFVQAQVNDTFLKGDEVTASARIFGTQVENGLEVEYEGRLFDDEGKLVATTKESTTAGNTAWLHFGKQDCGGYEVEVIARATVKAEEASTSDTEKQNDEKLEASDGVRLPLRVCESGTILPIQKDLEVTELSTIQPSLYPVQLSFYDKVYQPYVEAVERLKYARTNRNDSLVASYIAQEAIEKLFDTKKYTINDGTELKQLMEESYGMLPRLKYGEEDVLFTAMVAALAPELINDVKKTELVNAFTEYLKNGNEPSDVAAALLGLAALKRPVLTEINYAQEADIFSKEDRWILTAAYAYLGDYARAANNYDQLTMSCKESSGDELYIKGNDVEESIKLTAYALLSASQIRKTDAKGFYNYLQTHSSTLDSYQLEQASYLKYFYPMTAKPAEFSYTVGATKQEIHLEPGQIETVLLNKAEWNQLRIDADSNLRVRVSYLGGVMEALGSANESDRLKITKKVVPYDTQRNIYQVILDYTVLTDTNFASFSISDYIPNGARWYPQYDEVYGDQDVSGEWSLSAYVSQLTGQSVEGTIHVYRKNTDKLQGLKEVSLNGSVSYYIRGAVQGEFVLDSAVLRDNGKGEYAISKRGTIKIKENSFEVK